MDSYTVFADFRHHVHTGPVLAEAVEQARLAYARLGAQTVVVFDNATGDRTEVDPRPDAVPPCAWLREDPTRKDPTREDPTREDPARRPGPGRPRLGVVSREVSLLPRHWEWLAARPGGASAAIRELVDQARRSPRHRARAAKDAAYKFLAVVGGDLPRFEEVSRALYADRFDEAAEGLGSWPEDLRRHASALIAEAASAAQARG